MRGVVLLLEHLISSLISALISTTLVLSQMFDTIGINSAGDILVWVVRWVET